ncbi:protein pxr1-like [Nicotiana sylvestris]|uniref:protein pxr1-like n=1 Tax=Nicotiana sylvestris TaxID=4096 RepID=UPI00388C66BA
MTKNPVHHKRTKYIDVMHHFLRDNYEKGLISIEFCITDKQIADIFTKALSRENFVRNSKVKESSAPNSDSSSKSESFQYATEGEGHRSSDSEKTQEFPTELDPLRMLSWLRQVGVEVKRSLKRKKEREGARGEERGNGKGTVLAIYRVAQERLEESGMKSGGSGCGEAAEELIHLSKRRDESISSIEETLADLLRKIGTSYDPKKRKATIPKAPNVPNPSKKRKTSSPKPTASSMPKGRTTISRVKQSEAELQKTLEESKKKKMEKGKGKVAESSKVVEEEAMELVHQERGTTVEVPTPKPKKSKTSSKKSSSVPVSAEPSLAKRTKSAVKAK